MPLSKEDKPMKETAITATAQELAEHLFKNRDTLPEVEFSADSDDLTFEKDGVSVSAKGWNFAIAVLNFADTYMVIGNYFGGGSPFKASSLNVERIRRFAFQRCRPVLISRLHLSIS